MDKGTVYNGFVKVIKDGTFEIVKVTDSIAVLIYDVRTAEFVFVEQYLAPMKYNQTKPDNEMLLEVPAGRFDINLTVKQLIVKEVNEETGITIIEDDVELLNDGEALALSPGVLTEKMFLAYVEIDTENDNLDETKFGNAEEGEKILRIFIPVDRMSRMFFKDMKTFALIQWFMANKWPYYEKQKLHYYKKK